MVNLCAILFQAPPPLNLHVAFLVGMALLGLTASLGLFFLFDRRKG